jgi:hypothetical protein
MIYKLRWFKVHFYSSAILILIIAVEVILKPIPIKSDDTFIGWESLAEEVQQLIISHPNDFVFSLDNYKTTAALQFYIPGSTIYNKNIVGLQALQFAITQSTADLRFKNAWLIDSEPQFKNDKPSATVPKELYGYFENVEIEQPILIKDKNGLTIRKFNVYRCYNYLCNNSY